jgi:hypothetical protein
VLRFASFAGEIVSDGAYIRPLGITQPEVVMSSSYRMRS